ncbi:MAG: cytosine permease [Deltaproteobacteria bacterium]|nr:MAG: cytosine permease [Deltaproteobacteria bacterium]
MKDNAADKDFALSHVKESHKRGFFSMLVVMLGFTFFSASMWSGGKLGTGLTAFEMIMAVMAGNLILGIYTAFLAAIASKTGLSTHLLARYSFGEKGSYLPSFLLGITQVGWFGVGVAMFALPVQKITGLNLYIITITSGLIMTVTAWFGIRALTILSFVAVPSIAVLGFYSVGTALHDFGGLNEWFSKAPTNPITFFSGIGICVASFISGGTLTPDFVRFSKNTKTAVSTTIIAFFIGNSLMFIFGAVGANFYQEADISEVLLKQGMIFWAVIILGLNIWTTNDNALYASGLGFSNITKLPKKFLVLFNGLLGTMMAIYLYNNFVGWLSFLNTMLPSIGGIIIADYFILRKRNYKALDETDFKNFSPPAIAAWVAGVFAARYIPGIKPINSIFCSIATYIILEKIFSFLKSR